MNNLRRYDIDWVRVIAIGLLLIYHVAIGFQSWGIMIGFITNKESWEALWPPMTLLNVWRIPLLFFVSGMGVYFAIGQRDWKQLVKERATRILLPFLFGMVAIVPLHIYLWGSFYGWELGYEINPGHLWFLGNIFAYVLLFLPLFIYLKKKQDGKFVSGIRRLLSSPLGLLSVTVLFIAEALIINPMIYEMYAMTWHGFFLGLLAFFFGFCFMLSGDSFWPMILKWRWLFISLAVVLFALRLEGLYPSIYLLVFESNAWIISVFAFGYRYLNRPSQALTYLSQAAYPVYILHMIFLSLGSILIFPLDLSAQVKFIMVLLFTGVGCFVGYELVKRIRLVRMLFGLKGNGEK